MLGLVERIKKHLPDPLGDNVTPQHGRLNGLNFHYNFFLSQLAVEHHRKYDSDILQIEQENMIPSVYSAYKL